MIPEGTRDVLPAESAELLRIEDAVRGRFAAYGYGEVRTPTVEFAETVERAGDPLLSAGLRLFDESGRVLMVRTDMTVPVARLAATRLHDRPLPLRLCYLACLFRPAAPRRGQDGEFVQAGAELLGAGDAEADAESVSLLCATLAAAGLETYVVTLGSVAFHTELVATLGLDEEDSEDVLVALSARDYPLLESIVAKSGVDAGGRTALQVALELSGGDSALAEARKLASSDGMEAALERLVEVRDLVEDAGFGERVSFDFGLFQGVSYYTGLVFEAYAPGVGFPVASGGRYDDLLARFDWDQPAVGFALGLDRLHVALEEQRAEPEDS